MFIRRKEGLIEWSLIERKFRLIFIVCCRNYVGIFLQSVCLIDERNRCIYICMCILYTYIHFVSVSLNQPVTPECTYSMHMICQCVLSLTISYSRQINTPTNGLTVLARGTTNIPYLTYGSCGYLFWSNTFYWFTYSVFNRDVTQIW